MNLKKLRKEFGGGVEVTRDRRRSVTEVKAGGLGYSVDERAFRNESELAEHLKSKLPVMTFGAPG